MDPALCRWPTLRHRLVRRFMLAPSFLNCRWRAGRDFGAFMERVFGLSENCRRRVVYLSYREGIREYVLASLPDWLLVAWLTGHSGNKSKIIVVILCRGARTARDSSAFTPIPALLNRRDFLTFRHPGNPGTYRVQACSDCLRARPSGGATPSLPKGVQPWPP